MLSTRWQWTFGFDFRNRVTHLQRNASIATNGNDSVNQKSRAIWWTCKISSRREANLQTRSSTIAHQKILKVYWIIDQLPSLRFPLIGNAIIVESHLRNFFQVRKPSIYQHQKSDIWHVGWIEKVIRSKCLSDNEFLDTPQLPLKKINYKVQLLT